MLTTSYVSGASNTPLIGQTIGDLFDETARNHADRTALVARHQDLRYTYAELQAAVNRCARGLIALGLETG